MSDWGALHGGLAAAESGLDMAMPDGGDYWGSRGATLGHGVKKWLHAGVAT